jgi:hypothetical protein
MHAKVTLLLFLISSVSFLLLASAPLPATAQTSPAVPQFSLKLEDQSYDVAPHYTSDPFTGETIQTSGGYRVEKKFIDVIIQNPDSHSFYSVVNESVVKLYYNIRVKNHLDAEWRSDTNSSNNLAPSDADYTTIQYGYGSQNMGGFSIWLGDLAPGTQLDFQVQSINGFYTKTTQEDPICWRLTQYNVFNETGRSNWSATQTITIPSDSNPQATPTATTTPTSSAASATELNLSGVDLALVAVTAVAVAVAVLAMTLILRGRTKTSAV